MKAWLRRNVGGGVFAAIAVGIVLRACVRSPSARDLPRARARLAACLLGEPVSRLGPDVSRLRAIQLTGVADWPKRCAAYAADVEHALGPDLDVSPPPHDQASVALGSGRLFEFESIERYVEDLLTPGAREQIASIAEAARDVPPPPTPTWPVSEVASVAPSAADLAELGDHDLALVLEDLITCRFAARDGGLDHVAHCSYPADGLAYARNQWRPVNTESAANVQVMMADGIHGFATGALVAPMPPTPAAAQVWNVSGTFYVWPADMTRTSVLRRAPDGTTTLLRLPRKPGDSATLVRDQLLWTERDHVVGVALSEPKVGATYEVAKAAHLLERWPPAEGLGSTCATSEIAAELVGGDLYQYRVAVLANGTWRLSDPGPRYELHCEGGTVTGLVSTQTSAEIEIDRIDCDAAGCTPSKGTVPNIEGKYAVAALGKATILVWVDDLVRGISGPLAELATAKPFVIYDGARFERLQDRQTGMTELIQDVHVVGRGRSAIVVLDGDGAKLVYVRDGKPERVTVVFD